MINDQLRDWSNIEKLIKMTIVIKIEDKDNELKDILRKEHHLWAAIGKSGLYVELHKNCGPCKIPQILYEKEHTTLFSLRESGGSGFGQVICGLRGQVLTPFFISRNQAFFSSTIALVAITYYTNREKEPEIQIKKHYLIKKDDNVFVDQRIIYTGTPPPPINLRFFDHAAEAAVLKGKSDGKEIRYANIPEDKESPLSF